ncbi:Aste57867_20996 [Aphanomyces stellatus]|uniref:Aste57867_20996 protein n=1 Tax=Aphanomyces stellatus TaxID=120398 RepID=A0A485LGI0_9STRA|nr:hypothetical protein As57867_020928 [Aphanomyces stellatus]VFT97671.1 Aste57867_20996 [Aphanomyces stellatus]
MATLGKGSGTLDVLGVERAAIIEAYIERIQIQAEIGRFWAKITTLSFVPPNPYPLLLDHFRSVEAQWLVSQSSDAPNVQGGASKNLLFGRPRLLSRVDTAAVLSLFHRLNISAFSQSTDDGFSVAVACSLVGLAAFHGPKAAFPRADDVELEHHVVVEGEKLERAITVFAKVVAKDAYDTHAMAGSVVGTGVVVAVPSFKKSEKDTQKLWTIGMIQASRIAFFNAVKTAVTARAPIFVREFRRVEYVDYCGRLGVTYGSYIRVKRSFLLHIRVPNEPVRSFATNVDRAFVEGLFFSEDAQRAYLSVVPGESLGSTTQYATNVVESYSACDFVCLTQSLLHYVGVVDVNGDSSGAFGSIFDQLRRITSALAGEFYALSLVPTTITELVAMLHENPEEYAMHVDAMREWVGQFAFDVTSLVRREVHSALFGLARTIEAALAGLVLPDSISDTKSASVTIQTVARTCKYIRAHLFYVAQSMTRDMLVAISTSDGPSHPIYLANQLVQAAKDDAAKTDANASATKKKKPGKDTPEIVLTSALVEPLVPRPPKHGIDLAHEQLEAEATLTYPSTIADHAVRLQYIVDTRLDAAVESALMAVVFDGGMPENPYPTLIHHLRLVAARHVLSLLVAPPTTLLPTAAVDSVFPTVKASSTTDTDDDDPTKSCVVQYKSIYGAPPALLLVPDSLIAVAKELPSWRVCKVHYGSSTSAFSVTTWTSIYLRRLYNWIQCEQPHHVQVVEHIEVTPLTTQSSSTRNALELFSDAVLQDAFNLMDQPDMALVWLRMGPTETMPSALEFVVGPSDIKSRRDHVRQRIEDAARARQWVQCRVCFGLNLVTKTYVLHLVDGARPRRCLAPAQLRLTQTQIFLTQDDASRALPTRRIKETEVDVQGAGVDDLLDAYDSRVRQCTDGTAVATIGMVPSSLPTCVNESIQEDEGHVLATICDTKIGMPTCVKEGIEAWLGRVQSLMEAPQFQSHLALLARGKLRVERAVAASTRLDASEVQLELEDVVVFLAAVRLNWQYDIHRAIGGDSRARPP